MGSLRNLSRFKLITFDVTGTLLRLRTSPGTIYEQLAREEFKYTGLNVKSLDNRFRANFKSLTKELPNFGEKNKQHWSLWWSLLVHRTFKDVHPSIDPVHLKELAERLITLFSTETVWNATDKAVEFVHYVQQLGKCSGIITNSDPRTETILRNMNFPKFDFVLSAYDAGICKPDPRIFKVALEMSGTMIKPSEAMHIGNDLHLDYEAANDSCWTGVLINSDLASDQPEENKFKSLASFQDYLTKE